MPENTARWFDRVVVIMFENEYRNYVIENAYMRSLAEKGIDMASYFGVMHPSNTNYVASIAGETCGITEDPLYNTLLAVPGMSYPTAPLPVVPAPLTQKTIVDVIREKGLDWRAYMETYDPIEFPPQLDMVMESDGTTVDQNATSRKTVLDYPPYINAHNPFVRFQSIFGDREQWERIGTIYDFFRDCLDDTLPEYSWITPSVWGDGHWMWGSYSTPDRRAPTVDQLAKWLQTFFSILKFPGPGSRIPPKTLVVITFDESEFDLDYQTVNNYGSDYDGPNQIYTVLLGDMIAPRRIDGECYNHYSLLKTVEMNFGLASLGKNDRDANWFRFLGDEGFFWHPPQETPIGKAAYLAAAGVEETLWVVSGDAGGAVARPFVDDWRGQVAVPVPEGTTGIAMAASGRQLVLVCRTSNGLSSIEGYPGAKWSQPESICTGTIGAFALTGFTDYGDGEEKLMLVYAQADGTLQSQVFADGAWGSVVATGRQSAGALTVAALGTSLFAVYQTPGSNGMDVVSYNTAPFNVVTGTTDDSDTTKDAWSPSAFPVAHYSFGPDRTEKLVPEPVLRPYQGAGPFAAATLDGVVHLAQVAATGSQVMTETFSISGVFTPANAIDDSESSTGSNGWGTLAEAGWSRQVQVAGAGCASGGAMAMGRFGSAIALLTQAEAGGAVALTIGRYDQIAK